MSGNAAEVPLIETEDFDVFMKEMCEVPNQPPDVRLKDVPLLPLDGAASFAFVDANQCPKGQIDDPIFRMALAPRKHLTKKETDSILRSQTATESEKLYALLDRSVGTKSGFVNVLAILALMENDSVTWETAGGLTNVDKYWIPSQAKPKLDLLYEAYRSARPNIYKHKFHTKKLDCDTACCWHLFCFPCALDGIYKAANDPGFTSCSVCNQSMLVAMLPPLWPVFACSHAYILRKKFGLLLNVEEDYWLMWCAMCNPCGVSASVHRELELRGVEVWVDKTLCTKRTRPYENSIFAPAVVSMRECADTVLPLPPRLPDGSYDTTQRYTSRPPRPSVLCGSYCESPYNSNGHLCNLMLEGSADCVLSGVVPIGMIVYFTLYFLVKVVKIKTIVGCFA